MIDKQTNTRLKNFAQEARRYLIDQVNTKLSEVLSPDSDVSTYEKTKPLYQALLKEVRGGRWEVGGGSGSGEAALTPNPYPLTPNTYNLKPLAERVAYTWFNRFTALRFMDTQNYSPLNIISPQGADSLPQILAEAKMGLIDSSLISADDKTRVLGLLSGSLDSTFHKGDTQSEAYRILLLNACNYYGKYLPFLFKPIADWMEMLLPDDLLSEHSILAMIRDTMTPAACEDVEVIGWLYQYYISEKKDEVFANVKKGKKVQSSEIPAVTQLFTPHWIVKYMVQNSLGRLWMQSHPQSTLKAKMEFYVAQDAVPAGDNISQEQRPTLQSPEEIKLCDPCCGSGHILTYAFDLLYDIYSEEGYNPIDIPRLIIEKNLHGIEIDERAAELAAFALTMKARNKDRLWFSRGIKPQICKLDNISFTEEEIDPYMDKCGRDIFTLNFERMLSQFEHADTFGSLIVPYEQDIETISETLNAKDFSGDVFLAPTHNKVLKLIKQADYLSTKYQVVVTNPPYLGTSGFGKEKEEWFRAHYPNSRSDFFAMFMERCLSLSVSKGYMAMINMQSWMFLSSYEKLRKDLVNKFEFSSMAHLGPRAFDSIGGEVVSTTSFVIQNKAPGSTKGAYFRLLAGRSEDEKSNLYLQAIANPDCGYFFHIASTEFKKIPGAPIAYWVSERIREIFATSPALESVANAKVGLQTGDNDRFLRYWFETELHRIGFGMISRQEAKDSGKKWFPCTKGGPFRRWYGNNEYIVNWKNDGEEIRAFIFDNGKQRSVNRNPSFYFTEGWSWSTISSSKASYRFTPKGFIFETKGSMCFPINSSELNSLGGYLNSTLLIDFLSVMSPTLDFHEGPLSRVPYVHSGLTEIANSVITHAILSAKSDWDSYETSWDYAEPPLLGVRCQVLGVREAYTKLREQWIESTLKMQELEEKNNRIFIEAYGLQEELSPEVPLKEITLTCNPYYRYGIEEVSGDRLQVSGEDGSCSKALIKCLSPLNQALTINAKLRLDNHLIDDSKQGRREFPIRKDIEDRLLADTIKELISYAVGCMFGRYSLDKPGLILANQGETLENYLSHVHDPSFMPDADNVIPILEGEWFADDIVSRFQEFLKVSFGEENYSVNLSYIEDAIGKTIRNYFIKDFYNDHVKRYKKRPIYWLFSSPKGSFNALIFMHRYTADTVSIILNGYLREYLHKQRAKISQLEHILVSGDLSERDKILTSKEIEILQDVISELIQWEAKALLPLAEKRIDIDLDDGVKANYAKFGAALRRF